MEQSVPELHLEMLEDMWIQKEEIEKTLDDGNISSKVRRGLQRDLTRIINALGEKSEHEDDLVAKWERQIAEGIEPDLTEGL